MNHIVRKAELFTTTSKVATDLKAPNMPDESLSIVPGLPQDLGILEIRLQIPGQTRTLRQTR
jgi:hypothetical protein